ncbi:Hsp20/alpha crystallin family protein [Aspergillus fischeri NRRL 181]|uniref:SHSP domain-containing protein n=1 Tax=Neosartorya fischeri (strain ATCC 1020 / DSM 3700 / CBS 544.65 / FGSC A1164 / JCM 1740 / NRRL 181 / WB 181) TaxID=331117 RepID=A1CZ87_NEOFI|nr:conserved hypothetical protein [Aspergillus fischeri NRRL 181]EAW24057.1 conserved hypothetical protein [Aspergillus fischeri NRRL 181]KAG2017067.1 hypothetical protein GB937_005664 [Aspergillus fischeri]
MQHSCHFSQHPLAWDITMLEEHPFFAHPHPPSYNDSFESSSGGPSKGEKKAYEERAKEGMEDEHPEKPEFGFRHSCGRGRRGFLHRHLGPGCHLHPHKHEHDEENGFSRWTEHEGPGFGHHHHHSHHRRGHPWGMFRGLGRGRGFGHHFYSFHHMHPRFRSFHHSHDPTNFTPPVDVFVTPTHTIIHASLPGAQRSDLSVAYDASRSVLRMAGVVHRPGVDEEMYRALLIGERGRHLGVFEREVPISHNVAVEGIRARLVDGVLRVALPRVEGEVQQTDEEMDEVEKEGASSGLNIDGKEEEHEMEDEVEREYVKVDIQ